MLYSLSIRNYLLFSRPLTRMTPHSFIAFPHMYQQRNLGIFSPKSSDSTAEPTAPTLATSTSHHSDATSPAGCPSIMQSAQQNFHTYNILIIGGSYAGLSAAVNLLDLHRGLQPRQSKEPYIHQRQLPKYSIKITIIDERDGFCTYDGP